MPCAFSARMRSSGVGSLYSITSRAISVGAGELGSGAVWWGVEGSGVVSIGVRVKMCRFIAGAGVVGGAETSEDSNGAEIEPESTEGFIGVGVGRETGSDVSTWRRFPSNVEQLIE